MLADLMADFMANEAGVKVGPVAFDVMSDDMLHHNNELSQKLLEE